ncbi:MAG: DUF438 domain-containing protein [Bacteroidales bacterium]
MSELINNSEKRKALLKHMILELHQGEAPEVVKGRLQELLRSIPYGEVVEVEQELINEGLPEEEVLRLCDIHTSVLEGKVDLSGMRIIPPGHPADTFMKENQELVKVVRELNGLYDEIKGIEDPGVPSMMMALKQRFNALMDVDKHYRRKENLLFPYLERYEITGPPKVMWGKHDETRELLKAALEGLNASGSITAEELQSLTEMVLRPASQAVEDMTMKEDEILIPMSMDKLTELDWWEIYKQTLEIGFCLYDPQVEWKPEAGIDDEKKPEDRVEGEIQLPSGRFSVQELTALLNILPVDMTYVGRDDKVKYFSQGKHRIFDRNRAILGRDVRLCHPPSSVDVVETILEDFKSGKQEVASFWIQMGGRFILIEYFAMRSPQGEYLGTLEVSQDLTEARKLEGEQRLLSYKKAE